MKKALRIIVPVFLVMLFLSSCSKDPIEKILQHNDIVSLINEKKSVTLDVSYQNMEGYDDITYSMIARNINGEVEVMDKSDKSHISLFSGGILYILENEQEFYTVIMSDMLYSAYTTGYLENIDYYNYANYKLKTSKKDNYMHFVTYSFEINDILQEEFSLWGLNKGETVLVTYTLDKDWQLFSQTFILDAKGGEDKFLLTKTYRYDEDFIFHEKLEHYLNTSETVKISIAENMETQEGLIEYIIPKNTHFGYDFTDTGMGLYLDFSCTELFKYNNPVTQDITLYLGVSEVSGN